MQIPILNQKYDLFHITNYNPTEKVVLRRMQEHANQERENVDREEGSHSNKEPEHPFGNTGTMGDFDVEYESKNIITNPFMFCAFTSCADMQWMKKHYGKHIYFFSLENFVDIIDRYMKAHHGTRTVAMQDRVHYGIKRIPPYMAGNLSVTGDLKKKWGEFRDEDDRFIKSIDFARENEHRILFYFPEFEEQQMEKRMQESEKNPEIPLRFIPELPSSIEIETPLLQTAFMKIRDV